MEDMDMGQFGGRRKKDFVIRTYNIYAIIQSGERYEKEQ